MVHFYSANKLKMQHTFQVAEIFGYIFPHICDMHSTTVYILIAGKKNLVT